jgi:dTDP-3-amino-3,4,6-trideoxy-alpha-D-glucose transaminase
MTRLTLATPSLPAERLPLGWMDHNEPSLLAELLAAVEKVARAGAFTLGEEVEAFEQDFAAYCEARFAVGVSSGTEALALVLRALELGPGDEVIVPANSFIATAEAVTLAGATPRFADVDPESGLVTAELAEAALSERTRCIIPVHLHGRVADLDPILDLAAQAGVPVVEDAAQAHGARYRGRRVGALGLCGCFSFYPAKNLGGWGDGGAVVTDDPELADRLRLLRSHGERPRYHHRLVGTTGRLDAVQAAVLRVKLRRLDGWNDRRRAVAASLTDALAGAGVSTPAPPSGDCDHVFHQYVVRSEDRDALRDHLEDAGIGVGVHYPVPIHLAPAYAESEAGLGSLPAAEGLAKTILSLPVHPGVSEADVARISASVREFTSR